MNGSLTKRFDNADALEKLLTPEATAQRLGVPVAEVSRLAAEGALPAYRLGGEFLRFRSDDVDALRARRHRSDASRVTRDTSRTWSERLREFFYLHDFYLLAALLALLLIAIVVRFA